MIKPPNHRSQILIPLLLLLLCCLVVPPAWSIVCYHCDSIALPECAQTLGEVGLLPFIECPTELTCAMSIVDSITYRGCGAETPTTQATYAKSCSSNLCNAGVYPPGRLKCHHCSGESCVEAPAGKPRPCLYHHEEDSCYTDVINATLAYRGCSSEGNHTVSAVAQLCEINGCNGEQGAWTLTCVRCDSLEGRGCKMDLFQLSSTRCNISQFEQCQQQLLLGQQEQQYCFSYHQLSRVVRGCSSELPADLEPFRQQLVQCATGDNCNAGCMPQQRCLSCNSVDQELCLSNSTSLSSTSCGSAEASSCYACEYENFQIQRGCGAPPTDSQILNCYECDGSASTAASLACNTFDFTRCYRCSSDGDAGAGCANWERPGGIYIEECAQPAAPCLVVAHLNGTTERGCQREDFSCNTTTVASCLSCEGSFCNKGAYPVDRLWCHQCINCEVSRGQNALPCALAANEPAEQLAACLEYYDSHSGQIVRGCRSNPQLYYECMLRSTGSDPLGCRLCRSHGCNDTPGVDLRPRGELEQQEDQRALALKSSAAVNKIGFLFSLSIIYQVAA